ncbi:MAG: ribose-phosphate pyrophosphokinae [Pyrinomonadaceae bacterium]|nr:ribose-phosphate pyrophosphokinae [Pyrinomonadaceae bacterium]MDX6271897.1 ribose-phosphate pyrophosphokinae [Acidobacteriota bacterium]
MSTTGGIKVFSGNANRELTLEICNYLSCDPGAATAGRFSDGEFNFQITENVRGGDIFIVQPTCPPTDANLMELLVMLDAFRRSSAERVTAVIPYYGYARSDKKDRPRVPIAAKLVSNLIATAGAHRVLTMDLHAAQIQGFFDIPVDHLYAAPVFIGHYQEHPMPNLTVVAPDTGGAERARAYAKRLNAELALCDKRREKANVAEVMNVVGDVRGRNCLVVDDMCDTGGSLTKVAKALKAAGAESIHACFTHAVLSGHACEQLAKSDIEQVVTTNTIPFNGSKNEADNIKVLSIAPLLAKAIKSIHEETSVSSLFV